jgi:hypothetical protein
MGPGAADRSDRAPIFARVLALVTALVTILAAFFLFVRPWYRSWGAASEELARSLPGDEIIPHATGQETRAIAIHAAPDQVWPWLAQIGQDRGGFYSFDALENLVGCRMPTDDVLRPERQVWRVGDKLWFYPRDKAGGTGFATLRVYMPGRALAFGTHMPGAAPLAPDDGSWAMVVEPGAGGTTRLILRGRGQFGRSLAGRVFDASIFEPMHFAMERRMMLGIRDLAEGRSRDRTGNHMQVILWSIECAIVLIAIVEIFRRPSFAAAMAAFVAGCAGFGVLTLAQPPLVWGALIVAASAAILWLPIGINRPRR